MKKLLLVLGIVAGIIACEPESDNATPDPEMVAAEMNALVVSQNWVITSFVEDGIDETSNYAGLTFEFKGDGAVTATKNDDAISGTWFIVHDSGSDDSTDDSPHHEFDDIDFNIFFSTPDLLEELSEDWEIISYSDTKIELKHVSGGDGSVDYLTFEKI